MRVAHLLAVEPRRHTNLTHIRIETLAPIARARAFIAFYPVFAASIAVFAVEREGTPQIEAVTGDNVRNSHFCTTNGTVNII